MDEHLLITYRWVKLVNYERTPSPVMDCHNTDLQWLGPRDVVKTSGCLYVSLPKNALKELDGIEPEDLHDATLMAALTTEGEYRLSLNVDTDADEKPSTTLNTAE